MMTTFTSERRWIRRTATVLLTTTAALGATACFSEDPSPMASLPDECRELAQAAGVGADEVVIGMRNFSFTPNQVTVSAGTRVTWVNCEPPNTPDGDHTSTSDNGVWDSPLLDRGEIFQRTFDETGDFPFHCTPHPFMQGTVTVQ